MPERDGRKFISKGVCARLEGLALCRLIISDVPRVINVAVESGICCASCIGAGQVGDNDRTGCRRIRAERCSGGMRCAGQKHDRGGHCKGGSEFQALVQREQLASGYE